MAFSEAQIKTLRRKALSGSEMMKLIANKARIMTYPELHDYDTIEEVLGPHQAVIILYLTSDNFGHWVCLFINKNGNINFFDSYSLMPDSQLKEIDIHFRNTHNQRVPIL